MGQGREMNLAKAEEENLEGRMWFLFSDPVECWQAPRSLHHSSIWDYGGKPRIPGVSCYYFLIFLDYHDTLYLDLSFMISCILHYYSSLDLCPKSTANLTQHPFIEIGTLHVYHGMLRAVLDSRLRQQLLSNARFSYGPVAMVILAWIVMLAAALVCRNLVDLARPY
ncbi:hypothetical protein BJX62DRAFT_199432, partial [Aspergillus germanicus]